VADAHEAFWQHVEEESAQELVGVERHDAQLAAVGIVFPAEGDALAVEAEQAVVGDGDAMGVASQVAQHLRGSSHGLLGVDHPVLSMHGAQQPCELFRMLETCSRTAAVKQTLAIEALQPGRELAAEDLAQDLDGQEEAMLGSDPSRVAGRESAGGDDAVDMRMKQQVLAPGVKDGEQADLGSEVLGGWLPLPAGSGRLWKTAGRRTEPGW